MPLKIDCFLLIKYVPFNNNFKVSRTQYYFLRSEKNNTKTLFSFLRFVIFMNKNLVNIDINKAIFCKFR